MKELKIQYNQNFWEIYLGYIPQTPRDAKSFLEGLIDQDIFKNIPERYLSEEYIEDRFFEFEHEIERKLRIKQIIELSGFASDNDKKPKITFFNFEVFCEFFNDWNRFEDSYIIDHEETCSLRLVSLKYK